MRGRVHRPGGEPACRWPRSTPRPKPGKTINQRGARSVQRCSEMNVAPFRDYSARIARPALLLVGAQFDLGVSSRGDAVDDACLTRFPAKSRNARRRAGTHRRHKLERRRHIYKWIPGHAPRSPGKRGTRRSAPPISIAGVPPACTVSLGRRTKLAQTRAGDLSEGGSDKLSWPPPVLRWRAGVCL
jgi:hypothetical protein